MARGEQLRRQWRLLEQLQLARGRGLTINDLAKYFGIHPRTVQRDLELLRELGLGLEHDEDEFGKRYWRLRGPIVIRDKLNLTLTEAISLALAQELFTPLAGTPFYSDLENLIEKVLELVPDDALKHFEGLRDVVLVRTAGHVDYPKFRQQLRAISYCLLHGRVVEITYDSAWRNEHYTTRVNPYRLVYFEGDFYLFGWSHRSRDTRLFKLTRIEWAETMAETFRRPRDRTVEKELAGSFGIVLGRGPQTRVVVRFTGPQARIVEEREWHPSQTLERQADGSLLATYDLRNLVELKRWVRGFGSAATIVSPASLVNEMREELQRSLEGYGGGRPAGS